MSPDYVPDYSECVLPYTQWYQDDFLGGVRGMKAAEVGVYTILLMEMYARGEPLNMDNDRLARLCGADKRSFPGILEMLIEEGKIIRLDCGLWNDRCENAFRSRTKMLQTQKSAGQKSAEKRNKNNGKSQRPFNDRSTVVQPSSEAHIDISSVPSLISSEPENPPLSLIPKKIAIELLATKKEVVKITFDEAKKWQADFPAVDVPQELREMRSWLDANPSKRKTSGGMRRFIVAWLSKEQDKGGSKLQYQAVSQPGGRMADFTGALLQATKGMNNEPDQQDGPEIETGYARRDNNSSAPTLFDTSTARRK